jgi:small subunit ribosomal protein S2
MPKKTERLLIPREQYLLAGCHIGMTGKSAGMRRFIYKIRPNGLAVMNIAMLDKRIGIAAAMISRARKPLVVCRKEIAWDAVQAFSKYTGVPAITGRFMPGSLTNPDYKNFIEPDLLLVVDSVADRQAIIEGASARIPIIGLADTSQDTAFMDLVLPCNNKGKKSLALVFWGIASQLVKIKGQEFTAKLEDFGWE